MRFVLKKAQSSNAFGIRFLTGRDAQAMLKTQSRRRIASWCMAALAAVVPGTDVKLDDIFYKMLSLK